MGKEMSAESKALTQKLWSYCKVLRDDGLTYGDYLEQLTYLLFLKMAHERTLPLLSEPSRLPADYDWASLEPRSGTELEAHYTALLGRLAQEPGLLGLIFRKSQNRIQDPAKLRHIIVNLIGQETWSGLDADLAGDFYEDLLERTAAEGKAGAGQYFTPRPIIQAMVDCIQPKPGQTMSDPACGTGGFLLAFHAYVHAHHQMDRDQKLFLRDHAVHGNELVDNTARLCAMNLFLHGIGHLSDDTDTIISVSDALAREPEDKVDIVLANPPFGTASSVTIDAGPAPAASNGTSEGEAGAAGARPRSGDDAEVDSSGSQIQARAPKHTKSDLTISRPDFWATTSNKQLNFVQHIRSMLKIGGSAAIVVPDNVLFEGSSENSAGAKIRERLLYECDLHTILRLPTGIFYAQGVKANVVFFDRRGAGDKPATETVWVYDFRTNQRFTRKTKPLRREHLADFVTAYQPEATDKRKSSPAFKAWPYEEIEKRPGFNLDLWADLSDDSIEDPALPPAPSVIADEILARIDLMRNKAKAMSDSLKSMGA